MPQPDAGLQRELTINFLTKRRLNAPAVWLKPEGATPNEADAVLDQDKLDTQVADWTGENDCNLGIRLVEGHVELRIKTHDETWTKRFFEACKALAIDARAAFGLSHKAVSGIIFHIEDQETINSWYHLWPQKWTDKAGRSVETKFISSLTANGKTKPVWKHSQPLPGSRHTGDVVVWRPNGKPPAEDIDLGLEDLEPRALVPTAMGKIVRALAYATLIYWILVYLDGLADWDESLVRTIGGWLARLALEGRDINSRGKSLEGVCWAPIDTPETAAELAGFLRAAGGGPELSFAYSQAERELERNPSAHVPGWRSLERVLGTTAKIAIRRAFRAGLDIDVIEAMSERYVFDQSSTAYIDREAIPKGLTFEHKFEELAHRYKNAAVFVGKKPLNPFELYSASQMRTDVQQCDVYPGQEPGAILRVSQAHGLLNGEDRQPEEHRVLNVFRGFIIKPIGMIDKSIMNDCLTALDRMLGLLTQDNDAQMTWLKKFIAWTIQHPEIKQQVCPVLIGGQGIGKSMFGNNLMHALFGDLAGQASARAMAGDERFSITPFLGKLVTFVDEVRLQTVDVINEIKKLVRSDRLIGEMKKKDAKIYYVPSRMIIAANQVNIGLRPEDAADRTLFFIMGRSAITMRMTEIEFNTWTLGLKPFYASLIENLGKVAYRQHLMRYMRDLECTREELEDLKHSSRDDEAVVRSTMSKAREVARAIVADARVQWKYDFTAWFTIKDLEKAIERADGKRTKIEPSLVMTEFERAGVIETVRNGLHRFKWGYGKTIQKMGDAHNLPITPNWDYRPGDFDDNEVRSMINPPDWRGNPKPRRERSRDPDHMEPY